MTATRRRKAEPVQQAQVDPRVWEEARRIQKKGRYTEIIVVSAEEVIVR